MANHAQKSAEQAEKLHKRGLIAGGYAKMLVAWVYAASAIDTYDIVAKIQAGTPTARSPRSARSISSTR